MVKSGYDKMLNRVVASMPSSSSGFPIGEGCETGISGSPSPSAGNDPRKWVLKWQLAFSVGEAWILRTYASE